ncbi:MAG: hypothetical protein EBS29_12000, partial [Chloroflexia bacterium]|nr:hypothetical protein [Chloroflexia bacterium]
MLRKISLFWMLALVVALSHNRLVVSAQTMSDTDIAQQLATDTQNNAKIWQSSANQPVTFITIPPQNAVPRPRSLAYDASDEQIARAFLGNYGQIMGVRSQQSELTVLKQERTANA